jgi:hypothetical protein
LGLARGLGKDIVATARDGTQLPFDVFDIPVTFWSDSEDELEKKLSDRIKPIAERLGRTNRASTTSGN